MLAIYKRELRAYFHSFLGALFIGAMLLLLGIYFSVYNLFMGYPYIGYALSSIVFLFLISIPILTMRILAEERHQKTDQLILTAPVKVSSIVVGKFLALVTIFAIPMVVICIYPLILSGYGEVDLGESYLAILGFFLYGAACIVIGIFVSSLTESQVIAAVVTFGILFLGYIMSGICSMISATGNILTKILGVFDMVSRFDTFLNGSFQLTGVLYFLSVAVLFLVFTMQSIRKRRYHILAGNWRMGACNSFVTVISMVAVILLNFLTAKLPVKYTVFDVTANKLYSLSEETKELVGSLNEDVFVYVMANEEQADTILDTTLENYAFLSSHIKLSYVDPSVNPQFSSDYTDDNVSFNSVIVESQKRSKVIDYSAIYQTEFDYYTYTQTTTGYDGEGQLTSAIAYVTTEDMPKIYTLEGHGELSFDAEFEAAIEKENIECETINLLNYEEVPEDAEALVIYAPTEDFSEDDTEKLLTFMERGGNLLMISTYTGKEMPNFERILDFYGVEVTKGLVIEGDNNYYYQDPFYLFPQMLYDSITESAIDSGSYVFVPYAQGITVKEKEDVEVTKLLQTSEQSYARENVSSSNSYEKQEDDLDGPFLLGVKCLWESQGTLGADTSEADISEANTSETDISEADTSRANISEAVIYTSEQLFTHSADEIVSGTNRKLFLGTLANLVSHTSSVSVPVKSYEINYLAMPQNTIVLLAFLSVVVIPFAFLIGGFAVWFKRRKR